MSTGVVGPSSPTATSPPGPPVTDEVVSSSSSFAPATVPVPPPPSDSFVGGDFLFEDILNLERFTRGRGRINIFFLLFSRDTTRFESKRRGDVRGLTCAGNNFSVIQRFECAKIRTLLKCKRISLCNCYGSFANSLLRVFII